MKKIRVAINGFGRIGRAFLKMAVKAEAVEVVAINDLGSAELFAYLLNHDSVYGSPGFVAEVKNDGKTIRILDKDISFLSEKNPGQLPWKSLAVDIVVESTGLFTSYEKASVHLKAGAKRVVITAPVKDDPVGVSGATVLVGINDEKLKGCEMSSNASCTTNAASPVIAVLDEAIGIEKAILNTVHAYTASQALVDGPSKKEFREGRAAAVNIVPSSTGAAIAVTKALPALEGKFDGVSIRVPVAISSIADITFIAKRKTSVEEVNEILRGAAAAPRWKGILAVTDEELVSSDIIGRTEGSIVDLSFTRVVDSTLVKVMAWYDNETGYSATLLSHVLKSGAYL